MNKETVIEVLEEIAVLLELKGENPFKSRAYVNAARSLERWKGEFEEALRKRSLGQIKGFGEAVSKKVEELVLTGNSDYLNKLKASLPAGLIEMLQLPGLGPKKIRMLNSKLDIDSIDALEKACRAGQVASLSGFGVKTQKRILAGIEFRKRHASHYRLDFALSIAEPILHRLRHHPDVCECSFTGSLRRHNEIIETIDFLVSAKQSTHIVKNIFQCFAESKGEFVFHENERMSSAILSKALRARLRVVSHREFPFALAHFTGSKDHNRVMQEWAMQRGFSLNQRGLFVLKNGNVAGESLQIADEKAIFAQLDLPYIPPELREHFGEFEAAKSNKMPRLIEWNQIRGSLHNHSDWSDGHQSLEEIITNCKSLGLDYWAVTDHSRSSFQANGLDEKRLQKQIECIAKLNRDLQNRGDAFRLLTGSEVDILGDGRLDFEDTLLAELDVVVASVHQGFTQSEKQLTKRFFAAAENPNVKMLGHLSGRLLLEREAYAVNQRAVIDACAETGTWIELNANPRRFDLDWRLWHYAKKKGVQCVINCDAHRAEHAAFLRLGAGIARKGGLEKSDVINTLPLEKLRKALS